MPQRNGLTSKRIFYQSDFPLDWICVFSVCDIVKYVICIITITNLACNVHLQSISIRSPFSVYVTFAILGLPTED